jgi:alanine racemase
MRSKHISVVVDLDRIRASAENIRARTGVAVVAVIKADAYGLGAARVADALAPVVDDFAYFYLSEAREAGKPGLVIGPPDAEPAEFRELRLRPTVCSRADADRFRGMRVAISLDTGMQRFGCDERDLDYLLSRCDCGEIHTHACDLAAVLRFKSMAGGRGKRLLAACTSLLDEPAARLDGVRPGLALYRGALRVSTRLHSVRETRGPIGYTGFDAPRVGIILAGYSNRLAAAPVLVNGRRQHVLEVGMNSAYVTIDPGDRAGDEVVLLGDGLTEADVAAALHVREHEVLCRYGSMGLRQYATAGKASHETALAAC